MSWPLVMPVSKVPVLALPSVPDTREKVCKLHETDRKYERCEASTSPDGDNIWKDFVNTKALGKSKEGGLLLLIL